MLRAAARLLLILVVVAAAALLTLALLRWQGLLLLSHEADPDQWEIFGVDVSSYQGVVDWPVLADQGVDFAFIKATEGSALRDGQFAANWAGAQAAGIRTGAYHFLSYDSPGETQADNFISMVPVTEGALPPVVDIEFYGPYLENPPEKEHVRSVLDPLLERLEEHYGVKPILYVTYRSYYRYLAGSGYGDYPIWCSSPTIFPLVPDWNFWQYSHTARLEGYYGSQQHIDLNIFRGSREQFDRFGLS
ncbi:glycoside hydrolase family 25 protein [Intestinimonas massiliensis (ex Afouda et al. 2020)]|uniref:glycoside hydrolase family 25 protein n=1 Tax=Intestinimonas massiliensis (ex Afouda et al. 2020) TaxID=1673721 RepID=UPI001F5F2951|nr:GH25 family lysozyme [Intestinimonas massiliensis (ex Afouda et al. 2020)]